jgi:heme exporter protein C
MNIYKYASPATFYPIAGKLIPWFAIPAALLFATGLFVGFFIAPTDFQQGDAYRIIFIHVPAAWMGMLLYVLMAFYAGIGWAFNARLSSMMASSIAITGAMFTAISLITGALWGKPTWGTWWVWDARMTSTLILLFLYIGFISLQAAIDARRRHQCPDHLLLRAVVEHAASGRNDSPSSETNDPRIDAGGAAHHAGSLLALLCGRCADPLAMHYP